MDIVFTYHELNREKAIATIKDELAKAKSRVEKLGLTVEVRSKKTGTGSFCFRSL